MSRASFALLLCAAVGCSEAELTIDAGPADAEPVAVMDAAAIVDAAADDAMPQRCAHAACPADQLCVRSSFTPGACVAPNDAGVCEAFGHDETERVLLAGPHCCQYVDYLCASIPTACANDRTCGCVQTSICPIDSDLLVTGYGCACSSISSTTAACRCGGP